MSEQGSEYMTNEELEEMRARLYAEVDKKIEFARAVKPIDYGPGLRTELKRRRANKAKGVPGGKREIAIYPCTADDSYLIGARTGRVSEGIRLSGEAMDALVDMYYQLKRDKVGGNDWRILTKFVVRTPDKTPEDDNEDFAKAI